ncbi:MAG TPA: glycerophosphodiester phosphodiesterase [Chloroflexota bacterium]|jgi:glycerophosphoryl diester phosphodiesterase|nr:glycerophosphodiester phosphodiesterase [Chloroflexota bacterium]
MRTRPDAPLVVAHRGGAAEAPENTLAAVRHALAVGADAVEVDVRLTADGVPVCLHDATLDRTTNGRGLLAAHPAAAVARLDATARWRGTPRYPPEPPPPLAAVLATVAGRAQLFVELKLPPDAAAAAPLVHAVWQALAAHEAFAWTTALAFDWAALVALRQRAPGLATQALLRRPLRPGLAAQLAALGIASVGLPARHCDAAAVAAARAAGLLVNVWGANAPPAWERLRALGVAALTTDYPAALQAWHATV